MGIDPYLPKVGARALGVDLRQIALEDLSASIKWDVILLNHVYEHLANPGMVLSEVAARLAPNGVCLIRVPLVDSWAAGHYKNFWIQLDPPRHLYLHTERSIEILAAAAGLKIDNSFRDSTGLQFWGSRDAARGVPLAGPKGGIGRRVYQTALEGPAQVMNLIGKGDQGSFILRLAAAT